MALSTVTAGQSQAVVEYRTDRSTYFAGEVVKVELVVGVDTEFWDTKMIPLFRRNSDLPVHVTTNGIDDVVGFSPTQSQWKTPSGKEQQLSFALGDDVVSGMRDSHEAADASHVTTLCVEREFLASRTGAVALPRPELRYAYATQFHDDFINGRVPDDRQDSTVHGDVLTLSIVQLPDTGRPVQFSGAIGEFFVETSAEPRDVFVGESIKLVLRVEGEGNLAFFDVPALMELADFDVLGMLDQSENEVRTFTFDVAAQSADVTAIPELEFVFFDPNEQQYRSAHSAPIKIIVSDRAPVSVAVTTPEPLVQLTRQEDGAPVPASTPTSNALFWAAGALVLAGVVWLGIRGRSNRPSTATDEGSRDESAPDGDSSAAAFHARVTLGDGNLLEAFTDFLSRRLRCSPEAVHTRDLEQRLQAEGTPQHLAHQAAAALKGILAAQYGGARDSIGLDELVQLVDELEQGA